MELDKRENETPFEYHKRLIYGKLVDKTLSDVDYTELSKYVYGKEYASDVARRHMYGSRYTLDLIENECKNGVYDRSILDEMDEKIIELQKERQKYYDQRREFAKAVSSEARNDNLASQLVRAAGELNNTIGNIYHCDKEIVCDCLDNEAILVLSDWHYGLNTSNVFNSYNTEKCRQRVVRVCGLAKERIALHKCHTLHVVILGDTYHGAIHTSARVASEELVCDQLMQASEILAQTILELSSCVVKTNVYATYGNHARTVQNKTDSIHRDNMERIIPWWLTQRLSQYNNISIKDDFENEFILFNANGHDVCCSHGDNDNVRSSPRLLHTLFSKKYGVDIEYVLVGDKHHRESFEEIGVTSILCGSLCGSDDYANNQRLYSTPSQSLLIMNRDGLDAEYRLKCE